MKAVTWHGKRDVRVEPVPDPVLKEPTDAIIRVTSSGICGSDLHLYEVLGPFMRDVRRWLDDILPLLTQDADPLGVDDFASHRLPLHQAPQAYQMFRQKAAGTVKVLLKP